MTWGCGNSVRKIPHSQLPQHSLPSNIPTPTKKSPATIEHLNWPGPLPEIGLVRSLNWRIFNQAPFPRHNFF